MLQEHSLGGISVCALLKEALMSRASTQGFLEDTAIVRKKLQKEKKMTHIKTRHIQDWQLNTYLVKLFRATESGQWSYSTFPPSQLCVQPSVFGELKHNLVSKGNHWNSGCKVLYHDADRKAKQNKHQNNSWESAESKLYSCLINPSLF